MVFYTYILIFIYIFYVSFESFGLLARNGGYLSSSMSIGLAIQNQILSLNRFIGFLIAPMIGFYVDSGMTVTDVYRLGIIGNLFSAFSLILVYYKWGQITVRFCDLSKSISNNGYSIKTIFRYFVSNKCSYIQESKSLNIKHKYLIAQTFTTGLAMPSIFVLNILAVKNPEYTSTLLQMTTAISGLGNLLLNFYTIPLLAVDESRHNDVYSTYKSIFLGKVVGVFIFSPVVISLGFYL